MRPFFVRLIGKNSLLKGFLCILIFMQIQYADNPFRDVPLDHFAYSAIEKLTKDGVMEGYPDGTFKGRRVLTRYEFAVITAKILAKIEDAKLQSGPNQAPQVSPESAVIVNRLSMEFRTELDMLGVRVDSLEKRVLKVESDTKALDMALSNVHVDGFYQANQEFIFRSNKYVGFKRPGLHRLNQDVYLRFTGNPKDSDGAFYKRVEAFAEIKGNLSGVASNRLIYGFSANPAPGDRIDDFATNIQDDRKVEMTKAHFKSKANLMDLRIFSGEQYTDLKDPAILLTASRWNPGASGIIQGVEASGKYSKLTYFTSVLKRIRQTGSLGGSKTDLINKNIFKTFKDIEDDVFSFRTTFQPLNFEDVDGFQKQLTFGGTFVEYTCDYDNSDFPDYIAYYTLNNFNRVIGWDINYSAEKEKTNFDLTLNSLLSEGEGDIHDTGFKADMQYENRNLLLTFKGYTFGHKFRSNVSSVQLVDTQKGHNYNRGDDTLAVGEKLIRGQAVGEKLIRGQAKYTFEEGEIAALKQLTFTLTGQQKWWEKLTGFENQPWYGRRGRKLGLRTVADFHQKVQLDLENELIKDAAPDEKGLTRHTLNYGWRPVFFAGVKGRLEFISDFDKLNDNGQHYTQQLAVLGGGTALHRRLIVKGVLVDRVDWGGQPEQIDVDRVQAEIKYDILPDGMLSIKPQWRRQTVVVSVPAAPSHDVTDIIVTELNATFSKKFEGRAAYGWHRKEAVPSGIGDDYWNWFGELTYEPTKETEIVLRYGYDYDDPPDYPEVFDFDHTKQMVSISARTDF